MLKLFQPGLISSMTSRGVGAVNPLKITTLIASSKMAPGQVQDVKSQDASSPAIRHFHLTAKVEKIKAGRFFPTKKG